VNVQEARQLNIGELITALEPLQVAGPTTGTVGGLAYDSRRVVAGGAFFALRGSHVDGHAFIDQALAAGAKVVVMEQPRPLPDAVLGVTVADARQALARAAALYCGRPAEKMLAVGVTGTNGKTTITYLLEALLQAAGRQPAVIGTVSYRFGARQQPASHTTPESLELQQTLAEFADDGADALVMEVSSHALEQNRIAGIPFRVGIFTNLTPEHLDYHLTMESYYASKRRLFADHVVPAGAAAVINIDDPYGERLAGEFSGAWTCGCSDQAKIRARDIELNRDGVRFNVELPDGQVAVRSPLLGRFNVSNLLCAIAAAAALGIDKTTIATALQQAGQVPGRLERVANSRDALVLVDYAHTGDALENVLATVRDLQPRRLITVFGCGGDRDRSKRPAMGAVAARYSDLVIVTSDNPRTENPDVILAEIVPGVRQHQPNELSAEAAREAQGYLVIPDRRAAIDFAVDLLQPGDLLLVAGKGHEDYQIIGTTKHHFDDREELAAALEKRGWRHDL